MTRKKKKSKLEIRVGKALGHRYEYETERIEYTIDKIYVPDFIPRAKKNKVIIEVKGFFRPGDLQKYKAIRDCLNSSRRLIFIFANPDKPVRRGAQLTMGQWATKEGFSWYSVEEVETGVDLI